MGFHTEFDIKEDNLLAGPEITTLTKNITITAGTAMKRGTLITMTEGKGAATKAAETASYVLARDVDEKAEIATVYTRGRFNREAIIVANGDTVDKHEDELRPFDIVFTSLK